MLVGTGIDIVEHKQIERMLKRNESSLQKLLLNKKQQIEFKSLSYNDQINLLASSLTIKEAAYKAFGSYMGKDFSFLKIEIDNMNGKVTIDTSKLGLNISLSITVTNFCSFTIANVLAFNLKGGERNEYQSNSN